MKVILREDVNHLGYKNDVVDVKRGYWRNYLRPRGIAETATGARMTELTERMERRREVDAKNLDEANELKAMIDRTAVTVGALAGPQGKLFGSVGAAEIARAVEANRKLRIDAAKIKLDEPIKSVGAFQVPVELYQGVTAELSVTVEAREIREEAPQPEPVAKAAPAADGDAPAEEAAEPVAAETDDASADTSAE
jgi:large subunit ribosomal protein L9